VRYPHGVAELIVARADDDLANRQDDGSWTWRQAVGEALLLAARALGVGRRER
jgi:hypothetical protein